VSMPCDYGGCFECFMRDRVGDTRMVPHDDGRGWYFVPLDPFEHQSMRLNVQSNDRRYFDFGGAAPIEIRRRQACTA
jgi:hypothetical protein